LKNHNGWNNLAPSGNQAASGENKHPHQGFMLMVQSVVLAYNECHCLLFLLNVGNSILEEVKDEKNIHYIMLDGIYYGTCVNLFVSPCNVFTGGSSNSKRTMFEKGRDCIC
jgi:hypothetical protein